MEACVPCSEGVASSGIGAVQFLLPCRYTILSVGTSLKCSISKNVLDRNLIGRCGPIVERAHVCRQTKWEF
jgi:hypothetical protein